MRNGNVEYHIGDGTIHYLNPGIKRPVQSVPENTEKKLLGNVIRSGIEKRTRANVRIPIVGRILDSDGKRVRFQIENIDPTEKGFKTIRLKWALGLWIVSW